MKTHTVIQTATVFVALQCYQCSTMQVKQRKKSSNKWSCVICNEKQSVRKVFSQASMAKDVRNFVQKFNMSRQFVEQQQELRDQQEQTLGHQEEVEIQRNSKRTDWSQYIDPDVNEFGIADDDEGDLCEPNVVTELPKPLFKKPKLRDNYSPAGSVSQDSEKLRRPVFGKRTDKKKFNRPVTVPTTVTKENFKTIGENQANYGNVNNSSVYERSSSIMTKIRRPMSKLNNNGGNVDHSFTYTGSSSAMKKMNNPASKWQDFIDVDDAADGSLLESGFQEINHAGFETKVSDDIVEDDVHPDFL